MSRGPKLIAVLVLAFLVLFALVTALGPGGGLLGSPTEEYQISEVYKALASGKVVKAEWQGSELRGDIDLGGGKVEKFFAVVPERGSDGSAYLQEKLNASGTTWKFLPPSVGSSLAGIAGIIAFPLMFFAFLYFFVIKPAQMGGNQAMNFGRSKARRVGENTPKVTFDDVAGIDEAKQELFEIVDFLKNTKKYTALGAKIPKGILLTGPPGVGKTYLARAIAGEAGVPFFHISGSDFVEMFVGVGAARVRDLFETAKAHRPSLIFIDEIDAVGRQRGAGLGGGHDEREQTLNQLLVEMDGFDPNSGVIMIAATNRPDVLDPALLRPGRFDRQIVVDAPDTKGREKILKIHAKGKPLETDLDLSKIAKRTIGFTGADLANMLNEAALLTARRNKTKVGQSELEEALDRVIAGPERKSRVMDPKEREIIAYHEAGHAIVGELLEEADPVHKVTILPRGMSLGSTWQLPTSDKFLVSKEELLDDITALLGGRVAEEIVYGKIWTGASNDLERVTRIARAMVCEFGMSEKLGTLALGRRAHNPFLGRDYNEERNYGEDVAKQIDEEVRSIVDHCHSRARDMVQAHRHQLDALVQALLERETLDRDEFLKVMDGQPLPPLPVEAATSTEPASNQESEPSAPHVGRLEPGPA